MIVEVTYVSNDVAVGRFRDVLLAQFRGVTPASCVDELRKARRAMPSANKFVFFAVVEPTSSPPDQEGRKAFGHFFEDSAATMSALVCTYRGEGFRGAIVRAVVSGVVDLMPKSRYNFPRHVVASLDEAVLHVRRYAHNLDSNALLDAYRQLAETKPAR